MLPMVQTEPMLFNCGAHSEEGAPVSATLPPALTPESEVEELVDIFFDVDVAVNTFSRLESCDLQPGDTWRGMQGKMSVTAPVKKQRKKSDSKPQSQINKCHNEKRRRELENETINQLEELLVTCLAEVKQPDKNGIVREATLQIQEVLRRRLECPSECPVRAQRLSPVQAGEVSSTQQHAAGSLHYSELTTLIEALKHYTSNLGWILLEINAKGEIECVTENIKDLVQQERTELYKKPVFSILHSNDHAKLRPLLRNIQAFGWGAGDVDKFQAIQVRLLVNNSNGTDSTGSVECVIHCAPVRGPSAEEAGSVMCVIRRCEDASALLPVPVDAGPPRVAPHTPTHTPSHTHPHPGHPARYPPHHADHIIFRLDSNFTVLSCDLSGVENYSNYPISLVGARYLELVEPSDRLRIAAHLHEAVCHPAPPAVSDPFRIRVSTDHQWLRVTAHSRLFRAKPSSGEADFIMSTHSVLGDDDSNERRGSLPPLPPAPALGGPLMTSVANGESSAEPRYHPLSPPAQFSINDFDLDQWASPFDMPPDDVKESKESGEGGTSGAGSSRAPSAPLDVPLDPPAPLTPHTPAPVEETNRLRTILTKKDSNILKDLLKQEDEEATSSETSAPHTPLTPHTPHTPGGGGSAALSPLHSAQAQTLARPSPLQHPQAPLTPHTPHTPLPHHAQHPQHAQHAQHMQQSHHNNSDVLLKILKEKSEEDNEESRRGGDGGRTSQPSALLSQLLSSSNGPNSARSQEHNDYLAGMKRRHEDNKGAPPMPKRATPDNQQVSSSAVPVASSAPSSTAVSPSTSSAGMSALCQKNQILVALLARQQTVPPTPPPTSNPVLRAYGPNPRPRPPMHHQQHPQHPQHPHPQQHPQHPMQHPAQRHHALSNILAQSRANAVNVNGGPGIVTTAAGEGSPVQQSHLQMVLQGGGGARGGAGGGYGAGGAPAPQPQPPQPQVHYANTAPHHVYTTQQSGSTRAQSVAGAGGSGGGAGGGGGGGGDADAPNDQDLSDILDEVINNMPEAERPAPSAGPLGDIDRPQQMRTDFECKEKNAMINAIRQSLMQCETVSKPVSSSPGASPIYAVQSPPGTCNMSGLGGAGYGVAGVGGAGGVGGEVARARALAAEQQRARLLQMQRSQQMLVSPEAVDQSQQDLGSTINSLVSATPPNVSLTRTGYHHLYHPSNQIGSNYGTNKITSPQQNPMLSRQLSGPAGAGAGAGAGGAGGGYAGAGAAALHTPLSPLAPHTPQPYHRAPRPHLVGGYYEDGGGGGGYCGEFARRPPHLAPLPAHPAHSPHQPHPAGLEHHMPCAGNGGVGVGGTSEYVRNELRAVVGARSRPDLHPQPHSHPPPHPHPLPHPPQDIDPLMSFDMSAPGGGGPGGAGAAGSAAPAAWDAHARTSPSTTEAAGSGAEGVGAGGDEAAGGEGAAAKASLLQKLLSQ